MTCFKCGKNITGEREWWTWGKLDKTSICESCLIKYFPHIAELVLNIGEKTLGDFLTCRHCGYTGPDVETTPIHIGGPGYVQYDYCQDILACSIRWNDGHN